MTTVDPVPFLVVDIVMRLSPCPIPPVHPRAVGAATLRIPRAIPPRIILVAVTAKDMTPRPRITSHPEFVRLANDMAAEG